MTPHDHMRCASQLSWLSNMYRIARSAGKRIDPADKCIADLANDMHVAAALGHLHGKALLGAHADEDFSAGGMSA